ncbi:hypothetical protein [Thermocrinis minervae]|nr:hypothetical protein [Thermocrinis minervae]
MYPTVQGTRIRWEFLSYVYSILFLVNLVHFFAYWTVDIYMYLLMNLSFVLFLLVNTSRPSAIALYFILGSLYQLLASVFFLLGLPRLLVVHTVSVGSLLNTIVGAYYIFVPMLQVEEIKHPKLLKLNLLLLNLSLLPFLYGWYTGYFKYVATFGLFLIASLFVLAFNLYDSLHQRKSPLKGLDLSVEYLILSLFLLFTFLSFGILSASSKDFTFAAIHHDGLLYGFLLLLSAGAVYHIMPFLLWWKKYAPLMGRQRVPTLKDIFPEREGRVFLLSYSFLFYLSVMAGYLIPSFEAPTECIH